MINVKDLPAPNDFYPIKRALLSVFDKTGLIEFAQVLHSFDVELISTGGTKRKLEEAGLPVKDVSEITGFPEMLGGRVKSLHPIVHAGLLARKTDPEDLAQLEEHGAKPLDLVVVNLYPFREAISKGDVDDSVAIENIDIGGPTMLRSAAKNFFFTAVVSSSSDYSWVAEELNSNAGQLSMNTRRKLAGRVFKETGEYDQAISDYFAGNNGSPDALELSLPKFQELRYGENPHQSATFYGKPEEIFEKLHGKDLSFNNMLDLSAAMSIINEFQNADPTVAILKHTNPCGIAQGTSLLEAYNKAFATDRQSPFGGIVISNQAMDLETAEAINEIFTEIIIAPDFEDGVLEFLMQKKNRRLVKSLNHNPSNSSMDIRTVSGGLLVQQKDPSLASSAVFRESLTVATERHPTPSEMDDLEFAWRVSKHVKSNAIVYGKNRATLGIGAGQMSRIDASEIAVAKGKKSELDFSNCVVASDAFFPFSDGLLAAADAGAIAAIQPGGSVRDDQVIEAANERGMAMVFTGRRHFRH